MESGHENDEAPATATDSTASAADQALIKIVTDLLMGAQGEEMLLSLICSLVTTAAQSQSIDAKATFKGAGGPKPWFQKYFTVHDASIDKPGTERVCLPFERDVITLLRAKGHGIPLGQLLSEHKKFFNLPQQLRMSELTADQSIKLRDLVGSLKSVTLVPWLDSPNAGEMMVQLRSAARRASGHGESSNARASNT